MLEVSWHLSIKKALQPQPSVDSLHTISYHPGRSAWEEGWTSLTLLWYLLRREHSLWLLLILPKCRRDVCVLPPPGQTWHCLRRTSQLWAHRRQKVFWNDSMIPVWNDSDSSLNLKCTPSSDSFSKPGTRIGLSGVRDGGSSCWFGLFVCFFAQWVSLSLFFWGQNLFSSLDRFLAHPPLSSFPKTVMGPRMSSISQNRASQGLSERLIHEPWRKATLSFYGVC